MSESSLPFKFVLNDNILFLLTATMVITDVPMRNVSEGDDVEVCVTLTKKSLQDVRVVLSSIEGDATSKEFVCSELFLFVH